MRQRSRRGGRKTGDRAARYYALAFTLGLTIAAVSGYGTAWADSTGTDSRDGSATHSESATGTGTGNAAERKHSPASTDVGPQAGDPKSGDPKSGDRSSPTSAGPAKGPATQNHTATGTLDAPTATTPTTNDDSADGTESTSGHTSAAPPSAEGDEVSSTSAGSSAISGTPDAEPAPAPLPRESATTSAALRATPDKASYSKKAVTVGTEATATATATIDILRAPASSPTSDVERSFGRAAPASALRTDIASAARPFAATVSTAAVDTAPITPGAVSPIAKIVALPGRIVNAVLQLVGITTSANTGPSPISPAPFAHLFFAVFRRLEHAIGLDSPLSGQPVPPSLTYTGPLDIPTPTVAQFLNASATEYVLGGVPGGLTPFTVHGWPMRSLHLATGEDATVWVTPQNQIIIAYSGTTGGTNLLFNPLIAISQLLTDFQAGFGNTTPKAFTQALDFAQQVQAEAAVQGYAPDSIFVTGHSLGGWEAQYVAQQLGLSGIGFETPGLSTTVAGNGSDALFVSTATYGDMAAYLASDLPGLYPFTPYSYVPGGGLHPHYGPIVLLGDPNANTPMVNAAGLWRKGIVGSLIAVVDLLGNFFASHLPGVQAYNLDVDPDPGVVPWLGINGGPVRTGFGEMTIPEFVQAASDAGILVKP